MADDGWRLGHRPAIDGLRGVAVLAVMLAHAHVVGFDNGGGRSGVTLFFALSGFLITALLVHESADTGRIDLGAFYRRRAVRLLPALVVVVAAMVVVGGASSGDALWALSYIGNWHAAAGGSLGWLAHTWSLAIEEQFYVLFPFVFVGFARRPRMLFWLLVAAGCGCALWRSFLWATTGDGAIYYRSDTRADAILFGCALGVAFASGRVRAVPRWAGPAGMAGLVVVTLVEPFAPFAWWGATVAALSSVAVIAATIDRAPRLLESAGLRRAGLLSYGLYLWHIPIMWWTETRIPLDGGLLVTAATFGLSWVAAELSMALVERPMLRFKHRSPSDWVADHHNARAARAAGEARSGAAAAAAGIRRP